MNRTRGGGRSRRRPVCLCTPRYWSILFDRRTILFALKLLPRDGSSGLDLFPRPATKQYLLRLGLEEEFARDGFRIQCDNFGGSEIESDPSVDGQVVAMGAEEVERMQVREAAREQGLSDRKHRREGVVSVM